MKQLALVIGNGAYGEGSLKNPTNDALALTAKLKELGFSCVTLTDASAKEMDCALRDFGVQLKDHEVGLIFFAGHGMQIDGVNYLTAVDTDFTKELDAKHSSLSLDKAIETMEDAGTRMNVIVLDACRTNPYERRWRSGESRGLAPVYAPKGMIVAYATSPGQVAFDGTGSNGEYTSAILQHIGEQNVSIEAFFKRVRNSLSSSTNGKQISWEHTSLMGEYYFNNSNAGVARVTGYSEAALADSDFGPLRGPVGEIIASLKSYNYYIQNPVIAQIGPTSLGNATKDECFVLGRNIYQAACGQANSASAFIGDLRRSLAPLPGNTGFHVLNGILFEIYFDGRGRLRPKVKGQKLDEVFTFEEDERSAESFRFIQQQLGPYRDGLFYFPGSLVEVCVDVVLVSYMGEVAVEKICFEGRNVLYGSEGSGYYELKDDSFPTGQTKADFRAALSAAIGVPTFRLKINYLGTQPPGDSLRAPSSLRLLRVDPV